MLPACTPCGGGVCAEGEGGAPLAPLPRGPSDKGDLGPAEEARPSPRARRAAGGDICPLWGRPAWLPAWAARRARLRACAWLAPPPPVAGGPRTYDVRQAPTAVPDLQGEHV